jgi:hypothetical protein
MGQEAAPEASDTPDAHPAAQDSGAMNDATTDAANEAALTLDASEASSPQDSGAVVLRTADPMLAWTPSPEGTTLTSMGALRGEYFAAFSCSSNCRQSLEARRSSSAL